MRSISAQPMLTKTLFQIANEIKAGEIDIGIGKYFDLSWRILNADTVCRRRC